MAAGLSQSHERAVAQSSSQNPSCRFESSQKHSRQAGLRRTFPMCACKGHPLAFVLLLSLILEGYSLQFQHSPIRLAFHEPHPSPLVSGDLGRPGDSVRRPFAVSDVQAMRDTDFDTRRLRGGSAWMMSEEIKSIHSLRDISAQRIIGGTAQTLWTRFSHWVPLPVRYALSCGISNVFYFGLYWALLGCITSAGLAVTVAYLCSVSWQHALHRVIVYGKDLHIDAGYVRELGGIYAAYTAAFVLNPFITEGVIKLGKWYLAHSKLMHLSGWLNATGFLGSLFITGILNYFTVSAVFDSTSGEK